MSKEQPLILVVDSESESLDHLTALLKQSGYNTITAPDAIKGLASCRLRAPAIILLALNMPLMNGREMLNRLKADLRTEDIPVIFLLTEDDTQSPHSLWVMEDYEFLIKPASEAELLVRVKANLRTRRLKEELRRKDSQLKELTLVDSVTMLKNARYFQEMVKSQIVQSQRYKLPLTLILLQVDQQKDIQRTRGQNGTDSMASQIAALLLRHKRESDIAVRLSTNEFALLLPNTDKAGADGLAERILQTIDKSTFTIGSDSYELSISAGVSILSEDDDADGKQILNRARTNMEIAGERGNSFISS
ncbi:MAG: diguanylate cyclase [Candidatus Obscuribacterales bacterium]|nr:diguanylate cyclase [Candidatus Obscuribacterales bacterium]